MADANVLYVVVGMLLIGSSSAVVGAFTVLRQKSLLGDAIAHSVLPGICFAFLISGTKHPAVLLSGAFVTGWLSVIAIDYITKQTRIKQDAAIGLVLSVFFGFGMLLLTSIQHSGNANQSGLDKFLFGKAASILPNDIMVFTVVGLIIVVCIFLFYKEFRLVIFDPNYAESIGLKTTFYEVILSSLTVLAITVGIQAVGVVLMSALLITPAIAARYWTDKLWKLLIISALFGIISSYLGGLISYLAPSMPTGPWIVVVLSLLAFASMLFSPFKGLMPKRLRRNKNQARILEENILKLMYQLGEKTKNHKTAYPIKTMQERRYLPTPELKAGLRRLVKNGSLIKADKNNWQLSKKGITVGKRMVRLHRLWEMYLTQNLHLQNDHVHETAEAIEHILTPEMELQLERSLNQPTIDPHGSPIPRD
ncbi:UNVERIFIED_CONTAM: hypothetical protein GTU68_043699 [Idotea baltica]|nr:hypothetical protein [Idotea baltica]